MNKLLTMILLLVISNELFAQSKCQDEWSDLKNAQNVSRQSSNEWTRNWEKRAFNEYNKCIKRKNNSQKYRQKSSYNKNRNLNESYTVYFDREFTTKPIEVKARYTGEKQDAWLKYYRSKKTDECKNPKSTKLFAKCLEEREKLAVKFDMNWRLDNPGKEAPPAIKLGSG